MEGQNRGVYSMSNSDSKKTTALSEARLAELRASDSGDISPYDASRLPLSGRPLPAELQKRFADRMRRLAAKSPYPQPNLGRAAPPGRPPVLLHRSPQSPPGVSPPDSLTPPLGRSLVAGLFTRSIERRQPASRWLRALTTGCLPWPLDAAVWG